MLSVKPTRGEGFRGKRLAYLVSQYPAVNHTFILREIRGLRELGVDVRVASVLGPDRPLGDMSGEELDEVGSTFHIRPLGMGAAVRAIVRGLFSMPGQFFKGLAFALKSSRWSLRSAARHLRYFSEALITGFWMRKLEIGHVHTHFASTVALFTHSLFGIGFSITIHGPDEFNDASGFLMLEKVEAAKLVIAISSYGRSQVMRFSHPRDWSKVAVVRLGVDPEEFAPRRKEANDVFEIICVGRLSPAKAQQILLRACAELVGKGRVLLLRLVGGGPDRAQLEQTAAKLGIAENVVFHGPLSHDRVLELYRSADVFALASFAEGVPVVLMEAMALEIPCVATAITGVPELIRNGVEGLLVPPSDSQALENAIASLMDDPEMALRLAKAGRERILTEYDLDRNIELLGDTFADAFIV